MRYPSADRRIGFVTAWRSGSLRAAAPALPALIVAVSIAYGSEPMPFAPLSPDGFEPAVAESVAAAPPTLESLQQEVLQLRDEVAAMQQAQAQQKAPSPPKGSNGERPSLHVTAELQLDNYFFAQDAESRATVGNIPDGAAFRRARIGVFGDYKQTSYRLEMDFALPGRPSFLDVWGAYDDLPVVGQVKLGSFFEPFCLDRLTANRFMPFLERSLPDQPFSPSRSPGVAVQNDYGDLRGLWAVGVFRPRFDQYNDAIADTGDWAVTGRFTFMPYYDEAGGGRYYMHLGTGHSYRRTTNHTVAFRAQPEARLGAATPNVPNFIDTGDITALDYRLHNIEFAWSLGSVYLQAEYFWTPVGRIDAPDVLFTGWYAQLGWFLTGEHRPFRRDTGTFDRVKPFTEFFRVRTKSGVAQGKGAWELVGRISQTDLTDRDIGGGNLTDLSVGLNWYLTPYMRIQTNYIHAFLDPAATARTGADIFGTRIQYDF